MIEYKIWNEVGETLVEDLPRRYVTPEQFLDDSPMNALTVLPEIEEFFGTKPLNLFIVAKPYGWSKEGDTWTESWPPEGWDEAVERHKAKYKKFTKYKTHIWMDFYLVSLIMEASPDSQFETMMTAVEGRIQSLCSDLADYGFVYEGRIEEPKPAEFFKEKIRAFFNPQS